MSTEATESDLVLEANESDNVVAAPPEDLSDEEIFDKSNRLVPYKKINENTSAGRLQMRVPDAPDNLIELIYRKKCLECSAILTTISSALMHYNSVKHQNKIALKFLPHGTYNLPLSKEEIREIETGVCKSGEPNAPGVTPPKISKVPFRELIKKFEINENVHKLDLEFCRLCETPFSSKVAALQHYSGKKHKKKAENWSSYNPVKPVDTKDDLRCDVCNVINESVSQMESHLSGKKHQMRMKAYVERVNAGAIAPPMSSRGFCDFNNVEREEANPIDPSRYLNTDILPKNLTGSFLDQSVAERRPDFEDDDYGLRGNSAPLFDEGFDNRRNSMGYGNEFDNRMGGMGYGNEFDNRMTNSGFDEGFDNRRNGGSGFENAGGFEASGYMEDCKPIRFDYPNNMTPNIKRSFDMMPEEDSNAFYENQMNPQWGNSLSRSQMNAPYAPKFPNRLGSKFPVQTFGATKFRYSRK